MSIGITAFGWGILSAISLPLGAILGLWWCPKKKINSAFMAFGAGALLFALTIELFGHVPHHAKTHGMGALWAAVLGAVIGGVLFRILNFILNNQGAFLRKLGIARQYVAELKLARQSQLINELSKVKVLSDFPPEYMAELMLRLRERKYKRDETLFSQGDLAEEMFFILMGEVDIVRHEAKEQHLLETLKVYDTFGELGILTGESRTADAKARTDVTVYRILKGDFDEILAKSPELQESIQELAASRMDNLSVKSSTFQNDQWRKETIEHIQKVNQAVTDSEVQEEGEAIGGASLAIWLGIFLDGIPESLVIGMLALNPRGMSMAFIAGVFLANLPEAMSSAVSMKNNGMKLMKIMMMWGSICLFTGIGAYFGATLFPVHPTGGLYYFVMGTEGLAAGAMLTMIAETMLPEAFEQGGSIVGLSTLAGFLAALLVKVI